MMVEDHENVEQDENEDVNYHSQFPYYHSVPVVVNEIDDVEVKK